MPEAPEFDVAVVGAGIIGLAHAYLGARSGKRVALFERQPAASGASIRNFGLIWPIGQAPGTLHQMALRSREIWVDLLRQTGLPYDASGSLHAAYVKQEADVGREFAELGPALGYECGWLTTEQTLQRSAALSPDGLLGALWSSTELTVDPRQLIAELPRFLRDRWNVEFHFNTPVTAVEEGALYAKARKWKAGMIVIAAGDDFDTLFPCCFDVPGLTRAKLQMMRTVVQPRAWRLGPALAFGLSFRHYPTFQVCETLPALKQRIAEEWPEINAWGIHVMVSQTPRGELTIGDSHEYAFSVDIFDKAYVNELILNYARKHMRVPSWKIAETWHGVYAKHPELPYLACDPIKGIRVVTVTSGIGMTLSFGLAERMLRDMGVLP